MPQPLFPFHRARRPHQYHHAGRTPRLHLPDTGSILAFPHATVIRNCSKRYQRTGRLALRISRSRFLPSLAREEKTSPLPIPHSSRSRSTRWEKRTSHSSSPLADGTGVAREPHSVKSDYNRVVTRDEPLAPPPVAVGDQAVNVPEPDYDPLQPPRSPSRRRTKKSESFQTGNRSWRRSSEFSAYFAIAAARPKFRRLSVDRGVNGANDEPFCEAPRQRG